jgi:hypothetical protein
LLGSFTIRYFPSYKTYNYRSVVCLFQIPDPHFFHPGSRIKKIPGSGSAFVSKNLRILTQKIVLSSRKYDPEGSGSRFFTHPGSTGQKGAPDPGSGTLVIGSVALHNARNKDQDSNFLDKNWRRRFNEKNISKCKTFLPGPLQRTSELSRPAPALS